jgi:hypothetical protein
MPRIMVVLLCALAALLSLPKAVMAAPDVSKLGPPGSRIEVKTNDDGSTSVTVIPAHAILMKRHGSDPEGRPAYVRMGGAAAGAARAHAAQSSSYLHLDNARSAAHYGLRIYADAWFQQNGYVGLNPNIAPSASPEACANQSPPCRAYLRRTDRDINVLAGWDSLRVTAGAPYCSPWFIGKMEAIVRVLGSDANPAIYRWTWTVYGPFCVAGWQTPANHYGWTST